MTKTSNVSFVQRAWFFFLLVLSLVWVIFPDLIPGPIDDLVVLWKVSLPLMLKTLGSGSDSDRDLDLD